MEHIIGLIGFGVVCFLAGGAVSAAIETRAAKHGKVTVLGGDAYRYVKVEEDNESN